MHSDLHQVLIRNYSIETVTTCAIKVFNVYVISTLVEISFICGVINVLCSFFIPFGKTCLRLMLAGNATTHA